MKKKLLIIVIISMFLLLSIDKVYAYENIVNYVSVLDLKFCQNETIAKVIRIIKLFIDIIRIAVPILLIISASLKFAKAINEEKGLESVKKVVIIN